MWFAQVVASFVTAWIIFTLSGCVGGLTDPANPLSDQVLGASATLSSTDVDLELEGANVRITITGPSDVYFSVAFGTNNMWTRHRALVIDGFGELTEWIMGSHAAGEKVPNNQAKMISNSIENGRRTVVLKTPIQGELYTFPTQPVEIDWMNAVGFSKQYAMHKDRDGAKLAFSMRTPSSKSTPDTPPTPPPPVKMCLYDLGGVAIDEGGGVGDFPGASLAECRAHCEGFLSCKSFAFSVEAKGCHLKDKAVQKGFTPSQQGWSDYKTYYIDACGGPSGEKTCFVALSGVAEDEGESLDDSSGSLADCKARCSADPRCHSFAYSPQNSKCHTKTKVITPNEPWFAKGGYQTYYLQETQGQCPDDDPIGDFRHQVTFGSLKSSYDYIVVGGGAAGCAAAYTLAHENPTKKVLLIEAGPREPLDFHEGFAAASRNHDIWNDNGWRISSLLGGGTVRNGRSFRGIPRWYILDNMPLVDPLAFEESALWAADTFAAPRHWPNMQSSVLAETMKRVPEIRVPTDDPDAFAESAGYAARHFRGMNGLISSTDAPSFIYYTAYAKIEDGKRTSGQRVIEEYHGKNLDILVDTMIDKILFGSGGRADRLVTSRGEIGIGGELFLTANVYETPSLLQRSGLGPSSVLQRLGVQRAAINGAAHEQVGKGYWNNIYISRQFGKTFNFNLRFGQDMGSGDRLHTFAKRAMFGIEARIRGDHDLPGGWLDLECSSDMPRGRVEATNMNMRPGGQWPHEADSNGFFTVVMDCAQAYFLDTWWPMYKAFRSNNFNAAVDDFINGHWGLKGRMISGGEPTATNSGPRWADDDELRNTLKGQWSGDTDSIHYGGSCHACVDQQTFLLRGSTNVRIADLSVFEQPLPGNTMAAAYTIGHYVAKFVASQRTPTLVSKAAFGQLFDYRLSDLTYYKFKDEINRGYESLYKMDGSNLLYDWLYDRAQDHEFYHKQHDNGVCGITVNSQLNQFLISKGSYYNFAMKFYTKVSKDVNSGMQVRSYIDPEKSTGAQLFGPQFEIEDDDVGLLYHEGPNEVLSPGDVGMKNAWNVEDWNVYEVVVYDNEYHWRVNGVEKTVIFNQPNTAGFKIRDRIGLQVHFPMLPTDVGGESCWKHILVKKLNSRAEAEDEKRAMRRSQNTS